LFPKQNKYDIDRLFGCYAARDDPLPGVQADSQVEGATPQPIAPNPTDPVCVTQHAKAAWDKFVGLLVNSRR